MSKQKITATKCFEGKRHRWDTFAIENIGCYGSQIHKWCTICGSRTEFYKDVDMDRNERCLAEDNKGYFIKIPKCLEE